MTAKSGPGGDALRFSWDPAWPDLVGDRRPPYDVPSLTLDESRQAMPTLDVAREAMPTLQDVDPLRHDVPESEIELDAARRKGRAE